jgi:hypothetical protein
LQEWLDYFLQSALFQGVMQKYPQWRDGDTATLFPGDRAGGSEMSVQHSTG